MKTQFNEVTNNQGQTEFNFMAKLVSVADNVLENVNGTEYRVATIEFCPPNTETPVQRSAIMYEKNYQYGVSAGNYYLSTMTPTTDQNGNQSVLLKVSHLTQAARATTDDFASLLATIKPAVKAGQVA